MSLDKQEKIEADAVKAEKKAEKKAELEQKKKEVSALRSGWFIPVLTVS